MSAMTTKSKVVQCKYLGRKCVGVRCGRGQQQQIRSRQREWRLTKEETRTTQGTKAEGGRETTLWKKSDSSFTSPMQSVG
jgi:hypothetical protein